MMKVSLKTQEWTDPLEASTMKDHRQNRISRRDLIGGAAAAAALTILPRPAAAAPAIAANDRINLACIGVGDQGTRDMKTFLDKPDVHIVAICDVDENHRNRARDIVNERYGNKDCATYNDFREMLDGRQDIDAVLVITPDHSHTLVSIYAMKLGKHVYCQKPLTHTVFEARKIAEAARKYKVATQLGTVNQASEDTRILCEWIADGAIGAVREVHNWSNRPIWPQGIDRPQERPPVPKSLDWDLWLGPAPYRPYHSAYLPLIWRGWLDFGTGALGDMGCYSFDTIFRVLKLNAPVSVEGTSSLFAPRMWTQLEVGTETYPRASIIRWQFDAREAMPPVTVTWYDGGLLPSSPAELEDGELQREGLIFIGDRGKILCGFSGAGPQLIPESKMQAYKRPPKTLPRSIGHHDEWLRACRAGQAAGANFEFSGPVTEALLLGNVAIRARRKLLWDSQNMKVTNFSDANSFLHCAYRQPWTL